MDGAVNSSDFSSPQITLRDIAQRLGVSAVTVSMALRNHPRISARRRQEIRQTATQMGYSPNAMAVALAHKRHDSMAHPIGAAIAWINCWKNPQKIRSFKEFDLYWQGAEQAAASHGFRLEEFVVGPQLPFLRLEKILKSRNIQGVLIPPHGNSAGAAPDASSLDWNKFSIVRLGHSVPLPVHSVTANYVQGPQAAFTGILKNNYQRIGFCNSFLSDRNRGSFITCQAELPKQRRLPLLILSTNQTIKAMRNQLGAWMKKNKPDAIFTNLAEMRDMLQDLGYRVPQDIGLATTSVLDGKADAGLDQNSAEIGKVAVNLLLSLVYHHETGIPKFGREVLVDVQWKDGTTLPRRSVGPEARNRIIRQPH